MRKRNLLWAAAAGLWLAAVCAVPAMALEKGWTEEGGVIRYVDENGSYVKNQWKKKDGVMYYLDTGGQLAPDLWVDGTYCTDSKGAMKTEAWVYEDGTGLMEKGWYYLGRDGKAEKNDWKTIDGTRYCFDSMGRMRTGWYREGGELYYLGHEDQGYSIPGWRQLEGRWYYFQTNGRAKRAEGAVIEDKKYYFDEDGAMIQGWLAVKEEPEAGDKEGISRFVYLGDKEEGMLKGQWLTTDEDPLTGREGQENRYYLDNRGTPYYLSAAAENLGQAVVKIDGKHYFFDAQGRNRSGIIRLDWAGRSQIGYFGTEEGSSAMVTGRVTDVIDKNGDHFICFFDSAGSNKGVGYTGVKDGFLYSDGVLAAAEEGTGYQTFKAGGQIYLVNEQGRVQTEEKTYQSEEHTYVIEGDKIYEADLEGENETEVKTGEILKKPVVNWRYRL